MKIDVPFSRLQSAILASSRIAIAACLTAAAASSQDLAPRAYLITPVGSNAVTVSSVLNRGELVFDPSVPIEDARGTFQMSILSFYHSYRLLGRSANAVLSLPYVFGNFEGAVAGEARKVRRSGLADARLRFAMNLRGGPAMGLKQFMTWREKTLIGFSFTAVVPQGQYDPARVVNIGTNRWAFKPEIGLSRRWGKWMAEAYGGVWLFTANPKFFPGDVRRTQRPMGAVEAHVGYYVRPRLWATVDVNFWTGGRSSANGVPKQDLQRNSRGGFTLSTPVGRRQSLKFSFSRGTYVTVGGDFNSISAAWQYSWLGKSE